MKSIFRDDNGVESSRKANQVLDDALQHVPLSILVELVELRYRDQRNRFFLAILGVVLTLVIGSATIGYQLYVRTEDQERRRVEQQQERQSERARQETIADYIGRLTRTETRLQFARTRQSFEATAGSLTVDRPLRVVLGSGERKQFRIQVDTEGRYRVSLTEPQRAPPVVAASPVAFTPVMYLYKLRDDFVDPLATDRSSLTFNVDSGTHFLEVEELLSDPGSFVLTVTQVPPRD